MTKRWPNTPIWQRFEKIFRTTSGSRWRTEAAAKFRVKRSDLRRLIDREDFQNVDRFDKTLIDHLHRHAANLRQRAADVDNIARAFMRARNEIGEHYLIETPIEITLTPEDFALLTTEEPTTPWERVKRQAFAEMMEEVS